MNIETLYAHFKQSGETVTTDSRHCTAGSLFFALRGESFDGNAYAEAALRNGCLRAVVDNPAYAPQGDERYIVVDNVLEALQQLAAYHRRQWGKPILQITGTNGKTTTKELTAAVLSQRYRVLYTEGNLNNHIGVPLTLLRLRPEHELAIIETGANHPGEIDALSRIVEADYGLITNVGKAHLEGFGSFEGVIRTKTELYRYLAERKGNGIFVNGDNHWLTERLPDLPVVVYGHAGSDANRFVEGEVLSCAPYLSFRWRKPGGGWHTVDSRLTGTYNLDNFLAAAAVGLHFGVSSQAVSEALAAYVPSNNRSQLIDTGRNRLIVDAYNANPTSMMAALRSFRDLQVPEKMLILGDMRELGADSDCEHRKIIDFLLEAGFNKVWLVGPNFRALAPREFRCFEQVDQVMDELRANPVSGHFILIKGSNGIRLYRLPDCL